MDRVKRWAKAIRRDVTALWLAARDPRVGWGTKLLAGAVAAYALSPVDLIPDFIPILGLLDDLLIVPAGILLVVRLIPAPVMADLRERAGRMGARPVSRGGLAFILLIWLIAAILAIRWLSA